METNFTLEPVSTLISSSFLFMLPSPSPFHFCYILFSFSFLLHSSYSSIYVKALPTPHYTKVYVNNIMHDVFPQRCQLMRRNSTQLMKCKISFHKIADIATHATDVLVICSLIQAIMHQRPIWYSVYMHGCRQWGGFCLPSFSAIYIFKINI